MTHQDTPTRGAGPADLAGLGTDTASRPSSPDTAPDAQASPWDGIPPEVLYGLCLYDTDSAGGCG
jgi:hypothetical protein